MKSASRAKRTPAPQAAIDEAVETPTADRIVQTAWRLIEEHGLERFTLRQLGAELGCAHTAVYWHFRSRDDLLRATLDLAIHLPELESLGEGPWDERARRLCRATRRNLTAHPAIISLAQRFPGRGLAPMLRALTAITEEAGYAGKDAAPAAALLLWLVIGFSNLQTTGSVGEGGASFRAEISAQMTSIADAPILLAYEEVDPDAIFEAGLDCVIEGLRRKVPVTPASR